jgi:TRAP-type mannitol/chloroaromatic compound transport system permease small subunit
MRPGDTLVLALVFGSLALVFTDLLSGGGVGNWAGNNLFLLAHAIGSGLGLIGAFAWPVLLVPLLAGLGGQFISLPGFIIPLLRKSIIAIENVTLQIGGAARWFALGLVIVTATIVIQRYVFGFASTKLQESVIYMHALLFLLASASTLLGDGHVRVDIFYSKTGPKGKAWTELLGTYLALMPMCVLILVTSTGYIESAWRILEQSRESDGLPLVFLLKTAIPLFAILMVSQGFALAARAALTLSGQDEPTRPGSASVAEV